MTRTVVDLEAAVTAVTAALGQTYDGDLGDKERVEQIARTAVETVADVLGFVDQPRGERRPDYIPSSLVQSVNPGEAYL